MKNPLFPPLRKGGVRGFPPFLKGDYYLRIDSIALLSMSLIISVIIFTYFRKLSIKI